MHQHQDRGETFQCELCPFTSSRHFSLKLHMRCHQHFPRTELKVKEESFTDAEEAEAERASGTGTSPSPSLCQAPGEPSSNHAHIKEEPQDVALTPPFPPGRERPGSSSSSLDLPRISASPPGPGPGTPAASLFSPDISTKTATDLLMKLSGRFQTQCVELVVQIPRMQQATAETSTLRDDDMKAGLFEQSVQTRT